MSPYYKVLTEEGSCNSRSHNKNRNVLPYVRLSTQFNWYDCEPYQSTFAIEPFTGFSMNLSFFTTCTLHTFFLWRERILSLGSKFRQHTLPNKKLSVKLLSITITTYIQPLSNILTTALQSNHISKKKVSSWIHLDYTSALVH